MTKDEALTLEALKYAASKGYGRIVREIKIAPFTIKAAMAQPAQEPWPEEPFGHMAGGVQPPQRPWVDLTDESVTQVIDLMPNGINGWMSDWDLYEFAREVLAKSKEKNNAA